MESATFVRQKGTGQHARAPIGEDEIERRCFDCQRKSQGAIGTRCSGLLAQLLGARGNADAECYLGVVAPLIAIKKCCSGRRRASTPIRLLVEAQSMNLYSGVRPL